MTIWDYRIGEWIILTMCNTMPRNTSMYGFNSRLPWNSADSYFQFSISALAQLWDTWEQTEQPQTTSWPSWNSSLLLLAVERKGSECGNVLHYTAEISPVSPVSLFLYMTLDKKEETTIASATCTNFIQLPSQPNS